MKQNMAEMPRPIQNDQIAAGVTRQQNIRFKFSSLPRRGKMRQRRPADQEFEQTHALRLMKSWKYFKFNLAAAGSYNNRVL